ncbi:MAG: YetF domain-containing protein [Asticcacaulis sp.]
METVIRGAVIYFVLLIVLRLSGRRTITQMTPFDLVLLLIVAETTQQALLGNDFSLTNAFVLIVVLFTLDIGLSYIKLWFPKAGLVMDGSPTVLIALGKPDYKQIRKSRVTLDDISVAAREQHGLERLDQIKFAVLEADGDLSIIPESSAAT